MIRGVVYSRMDRYREKQTFANKRRFNSTAKCSHCNLRLDVRRKSDLPLYIGQIHAFYFDTTPYTLNDNVNTKSVWLNNLIDVCLQYCIETTWTMFQTVL